MSGVFARVQNGPKNLGPTEPIPRLNAALLRVGVPTAGCFLFFFSFITHCYHPTPHKAQGAAQPLFSRALSLPEGTPFAPNSIQHGWEFF